MTQCQVEVLIKSLKMLLRDYKWQQKQTLFVTHKSLNNFLNYLYLYIKKTSVFSALLNFSFGIKV